MPCLEDPARWLARRSLAALVSLLHASPAPAPAADPAKIAARRVPDRGDELRSAVRLRRGLRRVIANIYEAMLDYDYLARPVKLVPRTLEAMPAVQDGGATYVFRLQKGIFFTPDPAFKGKPRELTAADHAYGIKRLLDPAVKSPWLWLVEGKIVGARRGAGEGRRRPASSTTTRRFPASRSSTATRCGSG